MPEMYAVTVPSDGLVDVRRSATKLDTEDLRAKGLDACHVYFPGDGLILRLEGEGEGLLDRLREARSARSLLDSLETHAWFSDLKMPLELVARAGPPARDAPVTAVASYGVNPGTEDELVRSLDELAPQLDSAPASTEFLTGRGLVVHFAARSPDEVVAMLRDEPGRPLQHVLHEYTGYIHEAWGEELAFDLDIAEGGVLSRHNFAPDRPPSSDPSGLGRGDVMGTWDPYPPFRTPRRP